MMPSAREAISASSKNSSGLAALISRYCSIIGVTRAAASAGCAASGGAGMDCWIVIGCANYKILALGPIGLPRQTAFSTSSATGHTTCEHNRPHANAPLERRRQLTCRGGAPKTRHQCGAFGAETTALRETVNGRCIYLRCRENPDRPLRRLAGQSARRRSGGRPDQGVDGTASEARLVGGRFGLFWLR